jgi:hypothetical protein
MWKTFRVARRSSPLGCTTQRIGDVVVLEAGVRSPFGWSHRRTLLFSPHRALFIFDVVSAADGVRADSTGRLQFHPAVRVDGAQRIFAARREDGPRIAIEVIEAREASLRIGTSDGPVGWIAERFGEVVSTTQLHWRLADTSSASFSAVGLIWSNDAAVSDTQAGSIAVRLGTRRFRVSKGESKWFHSVEGES